MTLPSKKLKSKTFHFFKWNS